MIEKIIKNPKIRVGVTITTLLTEFAIATFSLPRAFEAHEIERKSLPVDYAEFIKNSPTINRALLNDPQIRALRDSSEYFVEIQGNNLIEVRLADEPNTEPKTEIIKNKKILEPILEKEVEKNYKALIGNKKYTKPLANAFSELSRYDDYIQKGVDSTGIDKNLVYAVFAAESLGEKRAISDEGAAGLAQLMKITGEQMGLTINDIIDERYHPKSLTAAIKYLNWIKERLEANDIPSNEQLILASYNNGIRFIIEDVKEHGSEWENIKWNIPSETRNYIVKVLSRKRILDNSFDFEEQPLFSDVIENSIKHELKKGESLSKLSKEYSVPLELIKEYNPEIRNFDKVKEGYVINIPNINK